MLTLGVDLVDGDNVVLKISSSWKEDLHGRVKTIEGTKYVLLNNHKSAYEVYPKLLYDKEK